MVSPQAAAATSWSIASILLTLEGVE